MNDTTDVTIRDTATVTVTDTVDGTKQGKRPGPCPDCGATFRTPQGLGMHRGKKHKQARVVTTTLSLDDCDPRVVAAAKAIRKPGQVFVIVSPEVVRVVNG